MIPKILIAILLTLGLAVAACGDDEDDIPSPSPTETATATPTPSAPTETPPVTPAPTPEPTPTPDPDPASQAAADALATWLGPAGDPDSISVNAAEPIVWADGCLGLGLSAEVCTDALVEGFRIELGLGDAVYVVRTDLTGDVVRWEPHVQILVQFQEGLTNLFLFMTDDGNDLEAQPVSGTEYGVDPDTLEPGDPVAAALADNPQDGPQLLVWIDAPSE